MKTAKLAAALTVLVALVFAAPASAKFSITNFNVTTTSSVAGAHPDVTTDLTFSGTNTPFGPFKKWSSTGTCGNCSSRCRRE